MVKKTRVDQALVDKGLAPDLDQARRMVMAGVVLASDQVIIQPSQLIEKPDDLRLKSTSRYVSRGGEKLQAALSKFSPDVDGCICADIGASTGGFTDCLLQYGAKKVFAIDVGYGILDWNLRNDPRVTLFERTNARELKSLPEAIEFITADVSFISLKSILPNAAGWYGTLGGQALVLIKPQFEATREESAAGKGVIRDPEIHQRVLQDILGFASGQNFQIKGLMRSPLLGPEGNTEFFAWLDYPGDKDQTDIIHSEITNLFRNQ